MIGVFYALIYIGVVTLPTVATEEDMVDAYGETSVVESEACSGATLAVGAGEFLGECAEGVGHGSIIEITHDDDRSR